MYQLEFTTAHSYGSDRGISVPVLLKSGPNSVRIAASIDTGATFCVFRNELAEALGLDLGNATPKRFHTATGSFEAFGHDVEISVLAITTFSTVYFFADASINKNVLGRIGWLDRVQLALVDHDSTLYVAPYGNA
jgi:predicted aspartyl protease